MNRTQQMPIILHNQIKQQQYMQTTILPKFTTIIKPLYTASVYLFSHQQKKRKFFKIQDQRPENQTTIPTVYPNQYPNYSLTDPAPIISRDRPLRYLTPKYEVPNEKMMQDEDLVLDNYPGQWVSPENAYCLNVGLIGPVNAGKSQLFGALAHRISAVSSKASTTTEIISGIKCFERDSDEGIKNIQVKYFDTPGLMYKKEGFISKGWKVLSDIDFSLLVVDSAKRFDEMTKESIKRLEKHRDYPNFMKAIVLNKIDLVDNRRKFDQLLRQIQKYGKFDKVFYVSAKTGYGIPELQQYLLKMSKKRQWQQPKQVKSDRTQLEIYEQMLRQGIFDRSYKELPHETDITCTSFAELSNKKHQIIFDIFVGNENQQRMIIGKEGRNIREVMDKFKLSYAKMYEVEAEPIVSVKIRNAFRNRFRGKEENIVDDEKQQDEQKLRALLESLKSKRSTGSQINLQYAQGSFKDQQK